jgi:threonine dehydratase
MTPALVTLEEVRAAASRIAGVARRTPVVEAGGFAGPALTLKLENLQVTGSFKLRGAFNLLAQLPRETSSAGVIAYSSGNHGQAVAFAARHLGIPATIVMPETATRVKVDGVRSYGAEVLFAGTTSQDRQSRAEEEAARRGLAVVPPFDHPAIVAGAGTTALEILEQCREVTDIYVPMGGGGQISGVAAVVKALRPEVRIVGVEPAGAARMSASRLAGRPVALARTASIADGLLTLRPGDLTFAHVRQLVDSVVTVDEDEIAAAVRWLFNEARVVAEPSGAAAVAGALSHGTAPNRGVVAIVSGGNIAPDAYAALITAPRA